MKLFDQLLDECVREGSRVATPDGLALRALSLYDAHKSAKKRQRTMWLWVLMITIPLIAVAISFFTWISGFDPFYLLRKMLSIDFVSYTGDFTIILMTFGMMVTMFFRLFKMRNVINN